MKTKILMAVVVSLLVILVVTPGIPAGNKGQGTGRSNAKAPPEIESINFIFYRYPTHAGPGPHPQEETDTYHFIKGGLHWFSSPVSYTINATGVGDLDGDNDEDDYDRVLAVAKVKAAFEEWDNDNYVPEGHPLYGVDFFSTDPEYSDGTPYYDGIVSWGSIDGTGGAVAMATISYWPWSKEIVSFEIVFDKDEKWDIYGDPVPTWPYTGEVAFDIQNVAAHEVGHVVGLDHVNAPKDGLLTMYRYTTEGETIKRDLGVGDQLGVVDLYD